MPAAPRYLTRSEVDDHAVSLLHGAGFPSSEVEVRPWRSRLERHSLAWVQAYVGSELVGFVNVAWDGGLHAYLLDTVVHPDHRHRGIGAGLVEAAVVATQDAGCVWLHVDYEQDLEAFYVDACGFRPTAAALLRLVD